MKKEDLEYFENLLLEKKKKLLQELGFLEESTLGKSLSDSTGDLSAYAYHMADQGTDAIEREKAFLLASREGRYLHHLNEALERVEKGEFGVCRSCGCEINKERLEAVPHATLCIKCKLEEDKTKR